MTVDARAAPRHWAQIEEATFVIGMRFLFWVYRMMGAWPFRLCLFPVLFWYLLTRPSARAASSAYLDRVRKRRPGDLKLSSFWHFASFADSLVDKLLLWNGQFDLSRVTLHGQESLLDLAAQKRGCLLICSHLGNLDLCRVLSMSCETLRLTVLVHHRNAEKFNRLLSLINDDARLNLMAVTEITPATAMTLNDKVAHGEFIAIAGDRVPVSANPRVAFADFLGDDAPFPVGPYVLASLLRCPTYLLFSTRTADRAAIHFEPFQASIALPRRSRDRVLATLAADYAARLEYHCLKSPLQWFNFYDFWQVTAYDPAKIHSTQRASQDGRRNDLDRRSCLDASDSGETTDGLDGLNEKRQTAT